jgi:hypothetical protein
VVELFTATLFVLGTIVVTTLFITAWVGSLTLLWSPRWIATNIVYRFWPERNTGALDTKTYRMVGAAGLTLVIVLTWLGVLEVLSHF